MDEKKNDELLKVIIDTQEIPFDSFSWHMDKPYIKEPTRNSNEPFQNLVPFEFDNENKGEREWLK